ncbi:MAG: hypothetical protein COU81_01475 [Candidatus Portnoybacteria bacterium CG10_big_fil_rev_8_21_14_0_10_36_7]|uniref:Uncharacterized protein n=1 Tax=Candidatus Portnoybacteria bacterium CG10_big_fil_rev_8_21_14_0_10_36_7 TaxID=1974812 RepID=A0A2M8KEG0_9BACT|nr:MAG: hypothetical protein COU81_01475 [Candidatus Portnoybacteria bacterium CG10_big_fil_rev_8_21_14_0_10_36_7]
MTRGGYNRILIVFFIAIGIPILFWQRNALANVPVNIMEIAQNVILKTVDTVNTVKKVEDIADTDKNADIQSYISGNITPDGTSETVQNVTVTETQKIPGTSTDLSDILTQTANNITKRLGEMRAELAPLNAIPIANRTSSQTTRIDQLTNSINDLTNIQAKVSTTKANLQTSIALDVNIVRNSAQTITDLQNIARDEQAKRDLGKLADAIQRQYVASGGIITNYDETLRQVPNKEAENYSTNQITNPANKIPVVSPATQTAILKRAKEIGDSLNRSADENIPTADTFTTPTFASLMDPSQGGSLSYFLDTVGKPENNAEGRSYYLETATNAIATKAKAAAEAEALANNGYKSIKIPSASDPSKNEILVSGAQIKSGRDAVAEGQILAAVTPNYADPTTAIKPPGSSNLITKNETLPAPSSDLISGPQTTSNLNWWDSVYDSIINQLENVDICGYIDSYYPGENLCQNVFNPKAFCQQIITDDLLSQKVRATGISLTSICGIYQDLDIGSLIDRLFNL